MGVGRGRGSYEGRASMRYEDGLKLKCMRLCCLIHRECDNQFEIVKKLYMNGMVLFSYTPEPRTDNMKRN